jgi:hypothetical protein
MTRNAVIIAAIALAGCSRGPTVRADVVHGAPANEISIRLWASDSTLAPAPVDYVQIAHATSGRGSAGISETIWAAAHIPGTPALRLPAMVQYGVAPSGYGSSGPAPVLPMGSYEVRVSAGGIVHVTPFQITALNVVE